MDVQEIFQLQAIKEIEKEILGLQFEIEHGRGSNGYQKENIKCLLGIRRTLLNRLLVMDERYKQLLADFNEAMKRQLIAMREKTIKALDIAIHSDFPGNIEAVGKCFLGYDYSPIHPVQTMRAKKMWVILNGTLDEYVSLYWDGVITRGYTCRKGEEPDSENMMLYLGEEEDNWNDELDKELTKDMHLIYPFHHLYSHTEFSIFDLLWVREFNIEIHVEANYATYNDEDETEDMDWTKYDFND